MTTYTIGRSDSCDIALEDLTVSRRHAELEPLSSNRFALRDTNSSYGTHIFRDGEWIEILEIEVDYDTPIRFGEHETTADILMKQVDATGPKVAKAPEPPIEKLKRGAPTPTPGPRAKGNNKTLMWILIGGGALAVIAIVAVVAVVMLRDGGLGTSTGVSPGTAPSGARGRLMAACMKSGNAETACKCSVDIILKTMSKEDLDLVLELQENPGARQKVADRLAKMTPEQRRQWLSKFSTMSRRMRQECKAK